MCDELPKAKRFVWGLHNPTRLRLCEDTGQPKEEEVELAGLNKAFFLADLVEDSDLVVPIDQTRVGEEQQRCLQFDLGKPLHVGALSGVLMDCLGMLVTQGQQLDMAQVVQRSVYQHQAPLLASQLLMPVAKWRHQTLEQTVAEAELGAHQWWDKNSVSFTQRVETGNREYSLNPGLVNLVLRGPKHPNLESVWE